MVSKPEQHLHVIDLILKKFVLLERTKSQVLRFLVWQLLTVNIDDFSPHISRTSPKMRRHLVLLLAIVILLFDDVLGEKNLALFPFLWRNLTLFFFCKINWRNVPEHTLAWFKLTDQRYWAKVTWGLNGPSRFLEPHSRLIVFSGYA